MSDDFVSFKCHSCNHCCTDVVCLLTPWDVRRIAKATGKNPFDFLDFLTPDEVTEVAVDDPTWLEVDGERYIMALKRDEETGCTFLNNETRFCSIYNARPNVCRLYPFQVIESRSGKFEGFRLHSDVGCPRNTDGEVAVGPLHEVYVQEELSQEDYAELVEAFNSREYDGKQPSDFVVMFTGGIEHFEENVARG